MPIALRDDVMYILLKKISEGDKPNQGVHEVNLTPEDFAGRQLSESDLLGHLDYLNQKQYIDAEFTGNAYGNQEDVPDAVAPKEFDARIANTFGASDGPLPHLITFSKAELTDKGRRMLEKMEQDPPQALGKGPAVPIVTESMPFLEKVMVKGNLEDIFDARDVTEVVFRTMRDMMTTEASDRVASELHEEALPTDDKALQNEVAELWKDTNPIVSFLSRIRPPLKIKADTFLFRINQEAGLPRGVAPEEAITAVFAATKDELSEERIKEVEGYLPDKILQLWKDA
ncbi:DUF2267 domain-containing protein [Oculatella sp. LEGE 06141]|uniref:DUF2267 domain-containing protein n=1 Tax=Oculatella sp. LEGE 06141 TaxID=1828648 RepID=UPI0018819BE1|nr:DUF2267 domain-containing protein [Oculatella sp. LEGE 06141]MBE9177986.1 DUF2267 domain-containing protein [Oculatella sp. LEGE 06141]